MDNALMYDCFISYHRSDVDAMAEVRQKLSVHGIGSFLDREHLVAGVPWPDALELALQSVSAVVVFLGPSGIGTWQKREIGFALDHQVQEEKAGRIFPVIPVILPGADPKPGFLFMNTWVDFRTGEVDVDGVRALVRSIRIEETDQIDENLLEIAPYRGLEVFREEHAAFFCGREIFAERLFEAVLNRSFVAIVGPSGSGKSSVCQAGLFPVLRRQRPPMQTWDIVVFSPGERPFQRLAESLISLFEPTLTETDRLAEAKKLGEHLEACDVALDSVIGRILDKSDGTNRLLILVDQFEEMFTTVPSADRVPFIELLLGACERASMTLVVTLRADFFGNALSLSRELSDRIESSLITLGAMRRTELEQAIVIPAQRVGLSFESGLVQRILDDICDEPGHLPLLEFALTEMWDRRQGRVLTHGIYDDIGGVSGAMAQRAEAIFNGLLPQWQKMARQVFTRLTRIAQPEEGSEDTRRRIPLNEFSPEARVIVKQLSDARLLVAGSNFQNGEVAPEHHEKSGLSSSEFQETVEVAHEALISGWSRLKGWLYQDKEFLLWQQRLRIHIAEWERIGRDKGTILRGEPLIEAERWYQQRQGDLSRQEAEFVDASVNERKQETNRLKKELRSRRLRGSAIVLTISLAVIMTIFILSARMRVDLYLPMASAEKVADEILADIMQPRSESINGDGIGSTK